MMSIDLKHESLVLSKIQILTNTRKQNLHVYLVDD